MKHLTRFGLLTTMGLFLALTAGSAAHAASVSSPFGPVILADGSGHGGGSDNGSGNGGTNSGTGNGRTGAHSGSGVDNGGGNGGTNQGLGGDQGDHKGRTDSEPDGDSDDPANQLPEFPIATVAPAVVLGSAAVYAVNRRRRQHETL